MNYHLYKGTAWTGPYSTEQIRMMVVNGSATMEDYVCIVGSQTSNQIKSVPELLPRPNIPPLPPRIAPSNPPQSSTAKHVSIGCLSVFLGFCVLGSLGNILKQRKEATVSNSPYTQKIQGKWVDEQRKGEVVEQRLNITGSTFTMERRYLSSAPDKSKGTHLEFFQEKDEKFIFSGISTTDYGALATGNVVLLIYDPKEETIGVFETITMSVNKNDPDAGVSKESSPERIYIGQFKRRN